MGIQRRSSAMAALRTSPFASVAPRQALRHPQATPALAALARSFSSQPSKQAPKPTNVLPQDGSFIKGTVNDPTEFPTPNKAHGSYHWTFERRSSAMAALRTSTNSQP